MTFLAVHPDLTDTVQVPEGDGPTFTLGFWPPREAERLEILRARLRKSPKDLDPIRDADEMVASSGLTLDVFMEICRWSVRGWSGFGDIACETETKTIDGIEHVCLSPKALRVLYANRLLIAVAIKAMLFNVLTEDQKKTSGAGWKSSFSTRRTGAASVTQASTPTPNP